MYKHGKSALELKNMNIKQENIPNKTEIVKYF